MSSQAPDGDLLRAAAALRREAGEEFTMERLAARLGVSRATLYRRAGGKAALLARLAPPGDPPAEGVRARILEAAGRVFAEHGFLGSRMEQVAAEAGVAVATVYRHFGDKDGLVRAFAGHVTPNALLRELSLTPTADVAGDLRRLLRAALPALHGLRDLLRLGLFGHPAERAYLTRVRSGADRTLDLLARYLAAQIAAGRLRAPGEPRDLALALLGLLFSFSVLGPASYGTALDDPEHTADLIVAVFLDGLRPHQEAHHDPDRDHP